MLRSVDGDLKLGEDVLRDLEAFGEDLVQQSDGHLPVAHHGMLRKLELAREYTLRCQSSAPLLHAVIFSVLEDMEVV